MKLRKVVASTLSASEVSSTTEMDDTLVVCKARMNCPCECRVDDPQRRLQHDIPKDLQRTEAKRFGLTSRYSVDGAADDLRCEGAAMRLSARIAAGQGVRLISIEGSP